MNENHLVGVFPDMTNEVHHSALAIGSSGLKLLAQTPLHYWAAYVDPDREPRKVTPSMKLGTACHTATLEPHLIDRLLIVMPEGLDRRTKEGKALWAEIVASGKEPLLQTEWEKVSKMADAVRSHPVSRVLFEQCQAVTEVSIFWVDPDTGVNCKIRPDIMVEPCAMFPNGLIADLKTTDDASPEGFAKSVWNWEMHLQAALYPEGFMAAFGTRQPPDFLWIAQEKTAPFANAYYSCSEELAVYGRKEVNRLRQLYAHCMRTGQWPGYSPLVSQIKMPAWAGKVIEDAIQAA